MKVCTAALQAQHCRPDLSIQPHSCHDVLALFEEEE